MRRVLLALLAGMSCAAGTLHASDPIVGLYVHQHWPYNHPYAARTWTLKDWDGFSTDLRKLGFNTIMIWPMLETIPDPPTRSDTASLKKHAKVIDMLHRKGMRAWVVLCPNIIPKDSEAKKATFEDRFFFRCDLRVNPADETAMADMLQRRKRLLHHFSEADVVCIIDSDPGGYPGSTNQEFIDLLGSHRKLLDELRPGIELVYWMHVGWEAYSRHYASGDWFRGTDDEQLDVLRRLVNLDPEPWGVANGLNYADQIGIKDRVVAFSYGAIEPEPSFPMTMFTPEKAWAAGKAHGPRGVMGNAQTHCVQLLNIFAFGRGAKGLPLTHAFMTEFADGLVPGGGKDIVEAWKALNETNNAAKQVSLSRIEHLLSRKAKRGKYNGLLFGSPERFLKDLAMMLQLSIASQAFVESPDKPRLRHFVAAAERWQKQHGYQNHWSWPELSESLRKLDDPGISSALDLENGLTSKGFQRIVDYLALRETATTRLIKAIRSYVESP